MTRRLLTLLVLTLIGAGCATTTQVQPHERVVFFPAVATPDGGGAWKAEIRGWVFDPRRDPGIYEELLKVILTLTGAVPAHLTDAQRDNLKQRADGFAVDNERRRRISVRIGGDTYPLEDCRDSIATPQVASGGDGLFRGCLSIDRLKLPAVAAGSGVPFELAAPASGAVMGSRMYPLESPGTVVVSDIDDTIKITEVKDLQRLLARTFYLDFEPVPKMSDVYRAWAEAGSPSLHFYYVSASPGNLYEPLTKFLEASRFPPGSIHLKPPIHPKDIRRIHAIFTSSPDQYKISAIEPIIKRFPKRCFVLVGDSGEKDPEAYAALWRQYPTQVARIFIRDLTGQGRTATRYAVPFDNVPPRIWDVFDDPLTIQSAIPVGCSAAAS